MAESAFIQPADQHRLDQDQLRERNQRQKWAYGDAHPSAGCAKRRPMKAARGKRDMASWDIDRYRGRAANIRRLNGKHPANLDSAEASVDSSFADGDVSYAFYKDAIADDTFDYDFLPGPIRDGQVLSQALAQAVEKFETKATERLVNDEYEVVGREREESSSTGDDDEYELV